jgi:hypothetical protein
MFFPAHAFVKDAQNLVPTCIASVANSRTVTTVGIWSDTMEPFFCLLWILPWFVRDMRDTHHSSNACLIPLVQPSVVYIPPVPVCRHRNDVAPSQPRNDFANGL